MAIIRQTTGLTFDDVLLQPSLSNVLPSEADVTANLTRSIKLNIPIVSAAMDTVTEGPLAIAMAQAGGIGVIHRNLEPEVQAQHIRQVKKFLGGPFEIHSGWIQYRKINIRFYELQNAVRLKDRILRFGKFAADCRN